MSCGCFLHCWEGEEILSLFCIARSQRCICLENDAILLAKLQHLCLHQAWVKLHLVNHGLDLAGLHQLLQVPQGIVGHTNGLHQALFIQLFHGTPGARVTHLGSPIRRTHRTFLQRPAGLRSRPMNHIEVQVVNPQLLQGLLAGLDGPLIAVAGTPNLRLNEDISTREATLSNGITNTLLILVDLRSVDQAIALLQGVQHGLRHIGVGELVGAKANHRHHHAVVQGHAVGQGLGAGGMFHLYQAAWRQLWRLLGCQQLQAIGL
mmetsp:Transcript_13825/g.30662  ORF Transcript_13825/g.30662 Transcript_13825/m.30662 type:complete len:263 (+) Transcript_13825:354-1142(+)